MRESGPGNLSHLLKKDEEELIKNGGRDKEVLMREEERKEGREDRKVLSDADEREKWI